MVSSVTVVTVAGPNDGLMIDRNARLIKKKNPGAKVILYVVDNSRHLSGAAVGESDRWELVDGVPLDDPGIDPRASASSHHGAALNRCLAACPLKTRYLLILDPDFFIYYDHWVGRVTGHMMRTGLAFFGAPWHPRWFAKYRGFPCVHCLFIDTDQVDVPNLDFLPNLMPSIASAVLASSAGAGLKRSFLAPLISYVYSMTLLRLDIGSAHDTGSKIYEKYFRKAPAELLVPYIRPKDFHKVRHLRGRIGRLLERALPDWLSFIPQKRGYFSRRSTLPAGLDQDLAARGWEEFQWKDRLFGIHMRRFAVHGSIKGKTNTALLDALEGAASPGRSSSHI